MGFFFFKFFIIKLDSADAIILCFHLPCFISNDLMVMEACVINQLSGHSNFFYCLLH